MLRCAELNINDDALNEMTMGMVYDMLIERSNDAEEYPVIADEDDVKAMFGGDDEEWLTTE